MSEIWLFIYEAALPGRYQICSENFSYFRNMLTVLTVKALYVFYADSAVVTSPTVILYSLRASITKHVPAGTETAPPVVLIVILNYKEHDLKCKSN